ncbi:MAG: interleukin-like EMT inducer domain-containing protein [Anaerolineae bacterium]
MTAGMAAAERRGRRRARSLSPSWLAPHLLALVSYALLAVALTWPLALRFATHVPGDGGDDPALTWNLWWVRYALEHAANPFACDFMFYPLGINLAFYTLTVLNGCLSVPLQAAIGLIAANNVTLLSSYVLGGYGAYLLACHLLGGRHRGAAWLAGIVYAFAAPKLFYAALGQFNIASSQWVPFAVLYMVRAVRRPNARNVLMAALFTAMQAWAEMTYASFLAVFLAILLLWRLGELLAQRVDLWRRLRRLALGTAVLGLALAILIAPLLAGMIPEMLSEGDFSVVGGGFADVFSADLAGFVVPTMLHPLLGGIVKGLAGLPNVDKGQHLFYGLMVWVLAVVALSGRRRRDGWFWAAAAVAFLALSLGPVLQVYGHRLSLPMPFQVTQALPIFKANRYPSRYSVMIGLCLAVLAAYGLAWLSRRRPGPLLPALVAALFLFENLSVPLPLSDMRVPALYETIRATPGDFAVLELPLAWRNGFRITGTADTMIMFPQYYQTYHEKRLLGGNTSRNPELKFQYFSEMPVLSSIVALEAGREVPAETMAVDRAAALAVLGFLGVRYVVTHAPPVGESLIGYVESVLPVRLIAEEGGMRLYEVIEAAAAPGLDLRLALAEGWGRRQSPAPAERPRARLLLPVSSPGADVALSLRSPAAGSVSVLFDGRTVATCDVDGEWRDCRFSLPAGGRSVAEVWLAGERAHDPSALAGERPIGATGVQAPVDVYVRSAGEEFGDFGHVYVGGQEASPNGRGYNVVVIEAGSGAVTAAANFDTHADIGASSHMAAFIAAVPTGDVVAVAAADEASGMLGEDAVAALRTLGIAGDLRGCFRCGHAAIGVKGAAPGTAVEAWGYGVSEAMAGRGLTEPRLYFELGAIEVRRP